MQSTHTHFFRGLSVFMSSVLLYSSSAAGINDLATSSTEFLQQRFRLPAKEFSDAPTKVFKGSNPKRDGRKWRRRQ
jgi:hypothetical protein